MHSLPHPIITRKLQRQGATNYKQDISISAGKHIEIMYRGVNKITCYNYYKMSLNKAYKCNMLGCASPSGMGLTEQHTDGKG